MHIMTKVMNMMKRVKPVIAVALDLCKEIKQQLVSQLWCITVYSLTRKNFGQPAETLHCNLATFS